MAAVNGTKKENVLAIGSLGSAQDESYLTLLSSLSAQDKNVDNHMMDRILEDGQDFLIYLCFQALLMHPDSRHRCGQSV